MADRTAPAPCIDWAVAQRPKRGEDVSGDVATVLIGEARCVIAVIDGLGHGPEAARAAVLAAQVIDRHRSESPDALLALAHARLASTRGATATVAAIDLAAGTLDWLGVGNVNGVVVRAAADARPRTEGVFQRAGVLGQDLRPSHRPKSIRLADGDCIVIATDGVRGDLAAAARGALDVDVLVQRIVDVHGIADDDALVFVGRYRPAPRRGATP